MSLDANTIRSLRPQSVGGEEVSEHEDNFASYRLSVISGLEEKLAQIDSDIACLKRFLGDLEVRRSEAVHELKNYGKY
jgi:hypothetical protein